MSTTSGLGIRELFCVRCGGDKAKGVHGVGKCGGGSPVREATFTVPACLSKPERPCRHNGLGSCRRCSECGPLEKPTIEVIVRRPR